ncbi:Crp/Fnr family transcriptional regulator [Actinomadura terrae]|uniref:Crp/Fnr family transcriptional regulator n=1 Tax=Actinomadura terrae TaxID=604353 RepID=UPI0027E04094|nr:Crp/Fnr family transcriptional regulator [Actinomadura terrae]
MTGFNSILPEGGWARLAGAGSARTFLPGELMLHQGRKDDHLLVLLHGRVKVTWSGADGNEIVLAVRGAGDVLGEIAPLSGTGHSANVSAIDWCAVRIVPLTDFDRAIKEMNSAHALINHAVNRLREGEIFRAELPTLPAEQRVIRTLLRLAVSPTARYRPGNAAEVPLDQREFGRTVGLSRGVVSGDLAKLAARGLIQTGRGRILIHDLDALRRMVRG